MAKGTYNPTRAAQFADKLGKTGLRPAEFAAFAGLSRSVVYHLSRGQIPSEEQQKKLENAFSRLAQK